MYRGYCPGLPIMKSSCVAHVPPAPHSASFFGHPTRRSSTSSNMARTVSRSDLLAAAHAFCEAFASKQPLDTILSRFSNDPAHPPYAIEYGLPSLAPFLGRTFVGLTAIEEYFKILAQHLTYENMRFSEYLADTETKKVSCKGQARFTWTSNGLSWDETFTYTLDFDDQLRVVSYQVWADSGAAYLARTGGLSVSES